MKILMSFRACAFTKEEKEKLPSLRKRLLEEAQTTMQGIVGDMHNFDPAQVFSLRCKCGSERRVPYGMWVAYKDGNSFVCKMAKAQCQKLKRQRAQAAIEQPVLSEEIAEEGNDVDASSVQGSAEHDDEGFESEGQTENKIYEDKADENEAVEEAIRISQLDAHFESMFPASNLLD